MLSLTGFYNLGPWLQGLLRDKQSLCLWELLILQFLEIDKVLQQKSKRDLLSYSLHSGSNLIINIILANGENVDIID